MLRAGAVTVDTSAEPGSSLPGSGAPIRATSPLCASATPEPNPPVPARFVRCRIQVFPMRANVQAAPGKPHGSSRYLPQSFARVPATNALARCLHHRTARRLHQAHPSRTGVGASGLRLVGAIRRRPGQISTPHLPRSHRTLADPGLRWLRSEPCGHQPKGRRLCQTGRRRARRLERGSGPCCVQTEPDRLNSQAAPRPVLSLPWTASRTGPGRTGRPGPVAFRVRRSGGCRYRLDYRRRALELGQPAKPVR
jgi:hypothetical protein